MNAKPKVAIAAAAALAVPVAIVLYVRDPDRGKDASGDGQAIVAPVWTGFKVPANLSELERVVEVPKAAIDLTQKKEVSAEAVFGTTPDALGPSQKAFGKWVLDTKTLVPEVEIQGKRHALKRPEQPLLDTTVRGYKLGNGQFEVYNERTVVMAREVTDTLFGVQDVNIYPGRVFDGKRYLETGDIVPVVAPRGTFSPVKLTVFGPPRGVDTAITTKEDFTKASINLLSADGSKDLPEVDPNDVASQDGILVNNPASRAEYEKIRAGVLPLIGKASYFSQETDTARATGEFEFKAGLKVAGAFGQLFAGIDTEEREEFGTVFVRGVEVSYTVAVDDRPESARWVRENADVGWLKEVDAPLMYVSEVVYGRAWIVVAISSLSTEEMTAVFNGQFNALSAKWEPDVKAKKESALASTKIKVFNLGGDPADKVREIDMTDFSNVPTQIMQLQKPALTPATARPIAYRARWLANDVPAGWVGVAPMKMFRMTTEPVTFDVTLRHYNVRKEFGGFQFIFNFGGGGKLNIGAQLSTDSGGPLKHLFYRPLNERNYKDINHPLIVKRAVPSLHFSVLLRQGELNGGIKRWEEFTERGDSYGEQSIDVNVAELLKTEHRSKEEVKSFPGSNARGNDATFLVTINPPSVPPLPAPSPLPDAVPVTKEDRGGRDSRQTEAEE